MNNQLGDHGDDDDAATMMEAMLRDLPIIKLVQFTRGALTEARVDALVEQANQDNSRSWKSWWNKELLDENLGSLQVELTTEDIKKIEESLTSITIQGDRYSKALTTLANRWLKKLVGTIQFQSIGMKNW
jgi:hypothetical protein